MSEKYRCKKCDRSDGMCICDLSSYTNIGDVSGCAFLDNHASYKKDAGSVFFQGWAYKHNQMKFKLNEKDLQIAELDKFVSELMGAVKFAHSPKCYIVQSDAWKKREK